MQAIILAAGMGKRLKELTKDNTKCMVEVNGVTLIDRMLHQIEKQNISRIIIVIGYEGQKLKEYIDTLGIKTPIIYVNNDIYDKTNNIYSLALAKEYLEEEDTLLFESDIIFEDAVIEGLLQDPRDTLAVVDKYESWMDGTCVKIGPEDSIEAFVPRNKFNYDETDSYYKTVNIYKFSRGFSKTHYVPFLDAYQEALGVNEYYEQVLRVIAMLDDPGIHTYRLSGELWYEIDDIQDLDIAESIFARTPEEKLRMLQGRYGGYWRYPHLLDFCYLVNPYYPTQRMKDELRAGFDTLLTQYPSGMRVNALVAAKTFGLRAENLIVGNGAAELIRLLMADLQGKTGFIKPTFEEYPNRYQAEDSVFFVPDNDDFTYTAEDVIAYFSEHPVKNLVIVDPDNPSGNYLTKAGREKLLKWSREEKITLVLDESFYDFSDEEGASLLETEILEAYPDLYVVKSISKSYGVPGLRLGILASGNKVAISRMKQEAAIWNINSFAEFYMQIAEKYKKDYAAALQTFRRERRRFTEKLEELGTLRVIPSQANYLMCQVTGSKTAFELTRDLLEHHNLLIKDLTKKTGGKQFIRLAIRNTEENDRLLEALKSEL